MAAYLEPKNGNFLALAEQLVNQSQTTAALKQSSLNQADLEASKAKIRNSHKAAIQELRQENQPQNRMRPQTLGATNNSGHQTKSVKRSQTSASQQAHALHQRPQKASTTAHQMHQRPQTAAQTAHKLHTTNKTAGTSSQSKKSAQSQKSTESHSQRFFNRGQGFNSAQANLFDLTPNQAAKPDAAAFLQILSNNPQLLDDPILLSVQGPLPDYLKPQIEQISAKLSTGQKSLLFFGSVGLSLLFTFAISVLFPYYVGTVLSSYNLFVCFLLILCGLLGLGVALMRRYNRQLMLNLFNPQRVAQYRAPKAQPLRSTNSSSASGKANAKTGPNVFNSGGFAAGMGNTPQASSTTKPGLGFWPRFFAWLICSIVFAGIAVKIVWIMIDQVIRQYIYVDNSVLAVFGFLFFVLFGSTFSAILFKQPEDGKDKASKDNFSQQAKANAASQSPESNAQNDQSDASAGKTPRALINWSFGSLFISGVITSIVTNILSDLIGPSYEENYSKLTFVIFILVLLGVSRFLKPKD